MKLCYVMFMVPYQIICCNTFIYKIKLKTLSQSQFFFANSLFCKISKKFTILDFSHCTVSFSVNKYSTFVVRMGILCGFSQDPFLFGIIQQSRGCMSRTSLDPHFLFFTSDDFTRKIVSGTRLIPFFNLPYEVSFSQTLFIHACHEDPVMNYNFESLLNTRELLDCTL